MANEAATHREVYADKAEEYLGRISRWLRENLAARLQVTYQGATEAVSAVLSRAGSSASQTVEDVVRIVAGGLLAPQFAEQYPDYPAFTRLREPITEAARRHSAQEAIRMLAGHGRTNLGVAILGGLELLDLEEKVRPYQSRYAQRFLEVLQAKPANQVVNREELIERVAGGLEPIEKDLIFKLEPEWVAVVLVALVYNGDIVLSPARGDSLDATTVERATTIALDELVDFRHYGRPRTLPLNIWVAIFEGLGLQPGLIRDENSREEAVRELLRVTRAELDRLAVLQHDLQQGLTVWNTPVFTDGFSYEVRDATVGRSELPSVKLQTAELLAGLRGYRQLLEVLIRYDTVGKLRNLRLTQEEVAEKLEYRKIVDRAARLREAVQQLQPTSAYLAVAVEVLPADHPWTQLALEAKGTLLEQVRRLGRGENGRGTAELLHGGGAN